jgi:FAD:protein FMN transferase
MRTVNDAGLRQLFRLSWQPRGSPMPEPEAQHILVPPARRRFLAQLGVLAGIGAFTPSVRSLLSPAMRRVEVSRPGLGTWIRIVAQDGDESRANRAIGSAFAAIRKVDEQMSIHRTDSQLARVNALAGIGVAPVDMAVLDVVGIACEGARRTADIYDPTVLPLMRLYGFYASQHDRFPADREIAATLAVMGHRHVVIDRERSTLGLAKRGAALDLGSIGKGWALDKAIGAIRAEGVSSALVDVGGNVYALGAPSPDAEGWSVGVAHPLTGKIDRTFTLRDMAVATSANNEQNHMLGEVRVGHLLDARQGRPADAHLSASVVATSGVQSDMLSTVAFLLGPDRFRDFPGATESHFIG